MRFPSPAYKKQKEEIKTFLVSLSRYFLSMLLDKGQVVEVMEMIKIIENSKVI